MLTAGISCTHITVTIVSIAIITIKASDVSTQQIILKGFDNLWLVLAAIPASKSISHNTSIMRSIYFPPAISDSFSVASTLISRLL